MQAEQYPNSGTQTGFGQRTGPVTPLAYPTFTSIPPAPRGSLVSPFRQLATEITNLILKEGPGTLRRPEVRIKLYTKDNRDYPERTIAEELARRSCDQVSLDLLKNQKERELIQSALANNAEALKIGATAWVMATGSLTLESTLVQMAKQEQTLAAVVPGSPFITIANMLASRKYESVQMELLNHPLALWYKTFDGHYVGTQLAHSIFPSVKLGLLQRHPKVVMGQLYSEVQQIPIAYALTDSVHPEAIRTAAQRVIEEETRPKEEAPAAHVVADAYSLLRLPPTATEEQIRLRHRELAKKLHPDMWMNKPADQREKASQWFIDVTQARDTILLARRTA